MKYFLLLLLALVCWFACCAGLQFLQPQALWESPLGWQVGLWTYPGLQILALVVAWRSLRQHGTLALWLGLLAWWAWPWQGEAQWLRIQPGEVAWHLALTVWICMPTRGLALLAAGALNPASWSALALAQFFSPHDAVPRGRLSWFLLITAVLTLGLGYRAPSPEHLAWAGLALLCLRGDRQLRQVAVFTLISAIKGAPTTAILLALLVVHLAKKIRLARFFVGLVASYALAIQGETVLNRVLLVPWQKQRIPLEQGLLPHDFGWWAQHIGPRFGFHSADLKASQWLLSQGPGKAMVITPELGLEEDRWISQIYAGLSQGRAGWGWHDQQWTLAAVQIKQHRQLAGSGLNWLLVRGLHPNQEVVIVSNQQSDLRPGMGRVVRHKDPTPGAILQVQVEAQSPLVDNSGSPPHLVLQPGANLLQMPLQMQASHSGLLPLPALDFRRQLEQLEISSQPLWVATQGVQSITLQLTNRSPHPVDLGLLAGLRLRIDVPGQTWQPTVAQAGLIAPGNSLQIKGIPLATSVPSGQLGLLVAWQHRNGELQPVARLKIVSWVRQAQERYFGVSSSTAATSR